ncbi:toll/interleukin-1 receptor domain-containing protein [Mycolicibacterium flavescens]|uniref:TIR domain-containing protein n=1 Tax=Mycolicibacterium flavescens TaxID=1776 RepID=A0A1E3RFJ1_MYCFV|nr:toll/interleukin-1 receptor domain-containing protein [Mycolicibacterium flavescens]MCV7282725.1 toll/interleukin-1 receptor domain-containing protein [Mycolicibacterium flavescens]ODQ88167.1 hypothetical protein BHQ18_20150 [Mycolicibacterium flavescens]
MAVFISYSSRDADVVGHLAGALRRGHHDLWMDDELSGGDAWWRAILGKIRDCDVFLAALSQNMLASKACQAEMRYALALGKPILPVLVGPVDSMRTNPLAGMQVIDFQQRSIEAWMELDEAVRAKQASAPALPDPLPAEPPMPFAYLMRLGGQISGSELTPAQQTVIVAELKAALEDDGDDAGARRDICALLRQLRDRPDVTYRTRTDVDALLGQLEPVPTAVPAEPDTPRRGRLGLILAGVAVAVVLVVVTVLVVVNSGSEPAQNARPAAPSAAAQPGAPAPQGAGETVAAGVSDGGACTATDQPLSVIPTDPDEPVLKIPQPPGWERNTWMESDGIFRFALYNNAMMSPDGVAASALVSLDEERSLTPADSLFMLKRGALSAIGATDVTAEKHTVCGLPAETVRYQTGAIAGLAPHPATLLLVVLQTTDRTYTASLTIEAADARNPAFEADASAMLTGFQMLPPAGR